ncbi:MAG: YraN family protein [Deltaproteobacteria bacterium]|nr:YraN family protein [Deltaproteobacteria bacterium]
MPKSTNNNIRAKKGAFGEELATKYLVKRGYKIITRNHRCPSGEIDIIAWDGEILCFIEVRTRSENHSISPLETINYPKRRRIIYAARDYISGLATPWPQMRFDAVGITLGESINFELVQGAFEV